MHTDRKLRVAIDCRIGNTQQGIGTALLALAKALSNSKIADQEYTFIVREDQMGWIAPYLYGPCKLVGIPKPASWELPPATSMVSKVKRALGRIAPLRFIWHKLRSEKPEIATSDGYVESHQFDVVHFPTQMAYLTDLPSIYQPHDLQHLHFPQFFPKAEFDRREREYRIFCDRASFVCVHAEWTKQDVIQRYGLPARKVVVIPWGVVFDAYDKPSVEGTRITMEKYGLPSQFFFYPAVTWPHKNHEAIIRALHILKADYSIAAHVYFTGKSTEHRPILEKLARDIGVLEQIHFLGFLTPEELQTVFSAATALVYPSKFEGFGLPLLEAFQAGLPVLSSNSSVLPEVAQDGALYFDPNSPRELAVLM